MKSESTQWQNPILTSRSVQYALQRSLRERFGVVLNDRGDAVRIENVLLLGVETIDLQSDLSDGAGEELKHKFLAAYSSSQRAVNAFAPFRRKLSDLWGGVRGRWQSLRFEAALTAWSDYRGTPSHLDPLHAGSA